MLQATSSEEALAQAREVEVRGETYVLKGYVGNSPTRGTYVEGNEKNNNHMPQGFLVFQPPKAVTPPHFHETNQFQVFVGGSGLFGKKPAHPVSVHYAGGHTPYGPIVAGEEGIEYFTLRQSWDPGAKYMPERRDRLKKVKREFRLAHDIEMTPAAVLRNQRDTKVETIIAPEEDGLAGYVVRIGGGCTAAMPDPVLGGGQYQVVVNGNGTHAGKALDVKSCLYVSADEDAVSLQAGPDGLELLVLQFPRGS